METYLCDDQGVERYNTKDDIHDKEVEGDEHGLSPSSSFIPQLDNNEDLRDQYKHSTSLRVRVKKKLHFEHFLLYTRKIAAR